MQIVAKLTAGAAAAFRSGSIKNQSEGLQALVQANGIQLTPMHPSITDGELSKFFVAKISDKIQVNELVDSLRKLPSVEAAYVTPATGLPS
jgi:hypothetical protein